MSRTASVRLALVALLLAVGASALAGALAAPDPGAEPAAGPSTQPSTGPATGSTTGSAPRPTAGAAPGAEAARARPRPGPAGPVLVVGDSLTWRGAHALVDGRRGWTVDGVRGRNVRELLPVLREHLAAHPDRYRTVVVALGTNVAPEWRKDHYRAAARMVPADARTVFVTPYRAPAAAGGTSSPAAVERTARYARWMRELADARPARRCVAPWRALAIQRPEVLVDGVHQAPAHTRTWARLVQRAVARCATGSGHHRRPTTFGP